jgi:hypothetical protein
VRPDLQTKVFGAVVLAIILGFMGWVASSNMETQERTIRVETRQQERYERTMDRFDSITRQFDVVSRQLEKVVERLERLERLRTEPGK